MKAVIMAGGFGTRIQPLTTSIPKPMLPVVNIPMMEHIFQNLISMGIEEFVILLYYKPEVIKNYFKDGSKWGVKINYVLPEADFGTAGAVKKAESFLNEPFIVVSGDVITDFDLKELVGFHEFKKSKLTLGLTSVPNPLQFGIVITDKSGKIQKFLEKPGWGEVFSDTINTGIYVIEPEILDFIPPNIPFDFSKDLFPLLMEKGIELFGFKLKGYWKDVGNPDAYREVHKDILTGKVRITIPGEVKEFPEGTLIVQGKVELPKSLKVKGTVVLGEGVEIGEGTLISNSVIGKNTYIGKRSRIENSVIWESVKVGDDAKLKDCVICSYTEIGNRVKAQKGAVISQKVKIEDDVQITKDVVIWPEKFIEAGAIVSANLVWGEKWRRSLFEGGKISGRINVELSPELAAKLGAAFGSTLKEGESVFVSRDYHKTSRMLKRAFISGVLSTGVNVYDLKELSLPAMRFFLQKSDKAAGIHFKASTESPGHTDILFFAGDGTQITTGTEKNIERIFFREKFRRVSASEIGKIKETNLSYELYEKRIKELIDHKIKQPSFRVVVDLMNGVYSDLYPELLAFFHIDSIVLNSYPSETKLTQFLNLKKKSVKTVSDIVKATSSDMGFIIFPHGESLKVISDKGEEVEGYKLLLALIKLIDETALKPLKVLVPVSCPSVLDKKLKKVIIERGKFNGQKGQLLKQYYFIGDIEGNFVFTDFSISPDAVFSSIKLLELLSLTGKSISKVIEEIPDFYFNFKSLSCPSSKKAKVMRLLSEEAMEKEASFIDGIKIFFNGDWVLLVPDKHKEEIKVFVQSKSKERGEELLKTYLEKVESWIEEKSA